MNKNIQIPDSGKDDDVTVKFSGGKDSTLTAYLMAEEFRKVHLITYTQYFTRNADDIKTNYYKLRDIFGPEKIIHEVIDVDSLYKNLFMDNYARDFVAYKTFLTSWVGCGACKLAMHAETIVYNIVHEIKYTCDGANVTGFDPSQQAWLIDEVKKLYKHYGMEYFSPIYSLPRSDLELLKLGLTSKKPTLFVGKQSSCIGCNFHNIYLRMYYLPRYGRKRYEADSLAYWKEKILFCKKYIKERTGR